MRGGFIAIFVDSDDTLQSLSLDLRSRRIPTINSESYSRCLLELTARSWEALLKKRIAKANENNDITMIKLEKRIAEQDLELVNLKRSGVVDQDKILLELSETSLELNGHSISLAQIFKYNSENLARGATAIRIESLVGKMYGFNNGPIMGTQNRFEIRNIRPISNFGVSQSSTSRGRMVRDFLSNGLR